jgi:hypothetical protein
MGNVYEDGDDVEERERALRIQHAYAQEDIAFTAGHLDELTESDIPRITRWLEGLGYSVTPRQNI